MTPSLDYRRSPTTIHRVALTNGRWCWHCYECDRWMFGDAEKCSGCDLTPHELELEHIARIRRELAEAEGPVQQEFFP